MTNEKKVFHIVPGGHTDPITGTDCKWNVFRICNTTSMDAAAITAELVKVFGKKWFFITPDYAYGHTLQEAFVRNLKKAGGTYDGDMLPINTSDFSATLIKAKGYKPNVLVNNMGGLAQINCMKQFTQFGMDKDMALGGALFELESIKRVPKDAQTGWWDMEWWWNQPGVPHVAEFVADVPQGDRQDAQRRATGSALSRCTSCGSPPTRRNRWTGLKLAMALEDMELPPEVALQPGKVRYRAGDHELMRNIFVGAGASAEGQCRTTCSRPRRGARRAGGRARSAETGCKMSYPSLIGAPGAPRRARPRLSSLRTDVRKGGRCCNSMLFNVTNGLIIGAFYVLMALGLSLILNLSNVINFAHGNFLALGGYFAFVLIALSSASGARCWSSPLLAGLLGFVIERLMIRRVYRRDPVYSLLLTFGLAFIIQDVCRYIWGPNGLPLGIPGRLSQPLSRDLFFITGYRVFMVAIVVVAVAGAVRLPALHAGSACASAPARSISRRSPRSASTCACCGRSISRVGCLLAGLSRRARRRADRPQSEHGR